MTEQTMLMLPSAMWRKPWYVFFQSFLSADVGTCNTSQHISQFRGVITHHFSQLKWANYLEHMDPKRKSVEQHLMVDTRKSKSLPRPNWNLEHRIPFLANQASQLPENLRCF